MTFLKLKKAMDFCAVAYAVSAVNRINSSLYAHTDGKTGEKVGTWRNLFGLLSRDPQEEKLAWLLNTRRIEQKPISVRNPQTGEIRNFLN